MKHVLTNTMQNYKLCTDTATSPTIFFANSRII